MSEYPAGPHEDPVGIRPWDPSQVEFIPAAGRPVSSGTVAFGTDPAQAPIGTWVPKLSARAQVGMKHATRSMQRAA